jgi:hypothetical protein
MAFARDATRPGVVYAAASSDGMYRSENDGATWTVANTGLNARSVARIAADRGTGVVHIAAGELFRSTSSGAAWSLVPFEFMMDVASDGGQRVVALDWQSRVLRSANRGAAWTTTPGPPGFARLITYSADASWVFAVVEPDLVYRSPADGTSWELFCSGLPAGVFINGIVSTPDEILVSTSAGIWSGSGGAFSAELNGSVYSITADPQGGVWAVVWPTQVVHRGFATGPWTYTAPAPFVAYEARGHPSRPETLYLATTSGVLRSRDRGNTWEGFGLYGISVGTLAVGANSTVLHAGVSEGGVWERSLVDPTGFYPLAPCRAVDTRLLGSPLVGGGTRTFALAGACGVPADAKSVAVNRTVVNPGSDGSLNVFPGDEIEPLATAVTFRAGRARANNATLPVSQDGNASLNVRTTLASGSADFLIDVVGFYR